MKLTFINMPFQYSQGRCRRNSIRAWSGLSAWLGCPQIVMAWVAGHLPALTAGTTKRKMFCHFLMEAIQTRRFMVVVSPNYQNDRNVFVGTSDFGLWAYQGTP